MAGYVELTSEGIKFIRKVCEGNGNTLLRGKSTDKVTDKTSKYYNPHGVLPYCEPATAIDKIWISNAKDNSGKILTTNAQLGEMLIYWFNKYSKEYGLNANIVAAQSYAESGYKIWIYPLTSSASGITQFIMITIYGIVILNPDKSFTQAEIDALTKNWTTTDKGKSSFLFSDNGTGKYNRPFLHQNICDNPQISIKAQCSYLKYIAKKTDGLASSTLFGYSRGDGLVSPSYTESIQKAYRHGKGNGYEKEGIIYVERIFKLLGVKPTAQGGNPKGYFGYDDLDMNGTFIQWNAEIAETELRKL